MSRSPAYVAVALLVQLVVVLLAVFTTGLHPWVPWHSLAILLVMGSIAVVRLVGGPPR
jgi:hypothetical protein